MTMAEIKSYKPGTFCWTDLQTSDPAAAKKFYSDLLGWKTEDMPMPGGAPYTMASIGGQNVGAMGGLSAEDKAKGMPPHWNLYVSVADVDQATKKAASLGAQVFAPAFDVMDVGRMSVIADPAGATLSLWQAKKHIGAGRIHEQGAMEWWELETRNVDACGGFYSKLFGWQAETHDMSGMKYTMFNDGKEPRAGMMPMSPQTPANVPSHWTVYFNVTDCAAATKKATSLGAKNIVPPQTVANIGTFAMFFDPQGALFALHQPAQK
jgi:predicted enzyme related to lactoylglutathione lyase